ncbi:hypothetical protein BKA56DRAFT_681009 [Ilyonectria sp. MPI-CAGE-AT-0026]|nr:hypothetical protein BKA56DRAFT_681009 [Ilyonectria sp. MPI-CAGE-AT-0026]
MLTLALLDEAFEANIRSIHDFYRVHVRPPRRSVEFDWKEEVRDRPVFRQPVRMTDGTIRTSDTEALHYYLYYLQRLGLVTGLMQILTPYTIRRGSGESAEAVGTQAQLQQVMNHIDAMTYQAYINQRAQLDLKAAFLGRPANTALMKAASHMSRFVYPRAPTAASFEELEKLRTDPKLAQLIDLRDFLGSKVRPENQVRSTRSYLRKQATTRTRDNFFNKLNTFEVNSQLNGEAFLDLGQGNWQLQPSYSLNERKMVAELICANTSSVHHLFRPTVIQ